MKKLLSALLAAIAISLVASGAEACTRQDFGYPSSSWYQTSDLTQSYQLSIGQSIVSYCGSFRLTLQNDGNVGAWLLNPNMLNSLGCPPEQSWEQCVGSMPKWWWQAYTYYYPRLANFRVERDGTLSIWHWNGRAWSKVWTGGPANNPIQALLRITEDAQISLWHLTYYSSAWHWDVVWNKSCYQETQNRRIC